MSTPQHASSDHDEHHQQTAQDQDQSTERTDTPRHHDPMGRRDAAAGTPPQRAADGAADGAGAVAAGRRHVTVDGRPVLVETEPALLTGLGADDWFIGPDKALHEVTVASDDDLRGWTHVLNLSMSGDEEAALAAQGGYADGAGPREGFFSYPGQEVVVDRVVGVAGQAAVDDEHAAVVGALTERWVSARDAAVEAAVRRAGEAAGRMTYVRSPAVPIADAHARTLRDADLRDADVRDLDDTRER